MPIDLESFREGYRVRAKINELQDLCSPNYVDRLFRNLERNAFILAKGDKTSSRVFAESSLKQAAQIVTMFSEFDRYLAEHDYLFADEGLSRDLTTLRRSKDSFQRELRRIYSSREGLLSSLDQEGIIRGFIYSVNG